MKLQFAILFSLCSSLFGQYLPNVQFSDLETTTDGGALYVSSPLSLRIYQVDIRLPQAVSGLSNDPSRVSVLFSCADVVFTVWMEFSQ